MTESDSADDQGLSTNTSEQAESQLHSLEQDLIGTGLYENANKTEYIFFWTRAISTLIGKHQKLSDWFTHLCRYISTQSDVNIRLTWVWNAIDLFKII